MYPTSLKFVIPAFSACGFCSSFVNIKDTDTPVIQLVRTLKYTTLAVDFMDIFEIFQAPINTVKLKTLVVFDGVDTKFLGDRR